MSLDLWLRFVLASVAVWRARWAGGGVLVAAGLATAALRR